MIVWAVDDPKTGGPCSRRTMISHTTKQPFGPTNRFGRPLNQKRWISRHRHMAIHPHYRAFYSLSIGFCIESAMRSIEALAEVTQQVVQERSWKPLYEADPEAVLNEIQNILAQGAAVSRYFWPTRERYAARGSELRETYGIQDDSPLRSRDLRNAIEHFDERLDEYLSQGIVGHIRPHYIGPEPQRDGVPQHFFRAYFVDSGIFQILDQRVQLDPISRELWRLGGGNFKDEP